MQYVKSDFEVLGYIVKAKALNPYSSLTVNKIIEGSNYSHTKVRSSLRVLLGNNLIKEGFMDRNAKTYFATQEGVDILGSFLVETKE